MPEIGDRPRERTHDKYERLIARAQSEDRVKVAIAHPCDDVSIEGAVEAARLHLIEPILVGPVHRIRSVADRAGRDIGGMEIVASEHSHDSAAKAVELVRAGRAEALMKGSLHTDELMGAVVSRQTGIRTARRISHCFIMDVPNHPDALIVTDAAVNIAPTLDEKVDIIQNAIDLAHAMGTEEVRVAILSAMETVTAKLPSTIEAAALCKMAERGQITGPCWTDRSHLTMRSAQRQRRSRKSHHRLQVGRMCSWFLTSKPEICSPKACLFSRKPMPLELCSVHGFQSS
jgi:phosphate acetyltransferase